MPARRMLTMRHLRRIMRLHHEGAWSPEIVRAVGLARSTVQDALTRAIVEATLAPDDTAELPLDTACKSSGNWGLA
jgi:hypothetical protein